MIISTVSRYFTPFDLVYKGKRYYLNCNLGYEFYESVPIAFVHRFDRAPSALYLAWISLVGTSLNLIVCLPLVPIFNLFQQ